MRYWPPFKNSSRLNSLVQRAMPPESDWPTFLCRSMGHAGKNQHAMTYLSNLMAVICLGNVSN